MKEIKPKIEQKKDPEMESLYEFEARSEESREYFKIKKPKHLLKNNI